MYPKVYHLPSAPLLNHVLNRSLLTGLPSVLVHDSLFSFSTQSDRVKYKSNHITSPWLKILHWFPKAIRMKSKLRIYSPLSTLFPHHSLWSKTPSSFLFKNFCSYYLSCLNCSLRSIS